MGLQTRDAISLEKVVSCHFREPPSNIDMEVSPVHVSSLSNEQREEARESSVNLFKKPIERLQDCSSFIS